MPDSIHDEDSFLKSVAPYLVRLFAILKHTSVQLSCLTKAEGEQMRKQLEEVTSLVLACGQVISLWAGGYWVHISVLTPGF